MKLYLSSYHVPVPEALFLLLVKPVGKIKMAMIPNAKDYYAELARNFKIKTYVEYFQTLGLSADVFDLKDFDSAQKIQASLQEYDFLWVCGGNTFNLRYEMQRSGFDTVIKKLVGNGMVFGGDSAGALIAGPTLQGVELADEPAFAPERIDNGLGIVRQIVIPHADSREFGDAITKMIERYKDNPDAVVINDNQAVVINGQEMKVVTAPDV